MRTAPGSAYSLDVFPVLASKKPFLQAHNPRLEASF
jgi:hypothetical protein